MNRFGLALAFASVVLCSCTDDGPPGDDAPGDDEIGLSEDSDSDSDSDSSDSSSEDSSSEDSSSEDSSSEDSSSTGGPGREIGLLCAGLEPSQRPPTQGSNPGASSPFGEGKSTNVVLGPVEDLSAIEDSIAPGAVSAAADLSQATYDLRVPAAFDGSEAYGLIVFINTTNNGTTPGVPYGKELDQRKLLWLAPDDAGDDVPVSARMGLAYLGAVRAMERFNVDPRRVYIMGSSGGARSANMLAYQHPQLFTGTLARCGANYPAMVAQTYETYEPDSHYEFWGAGFFPDVQGQPYLDHLRGLDRRFSLMTSFIDYREGDLMNIYHHGFEADALFARLVETKGPHCSTNRAHLRDALGFVDHPGWRIVDDSFDDGAHWFNAQEGEGVVDIEGPMGEVYEAGGALHLPAQPGQFSAALVRNRTWWRDRHGLIARARLDFSAAEGGFADLGLVAYDDAVHGGEHPSGAPVRAKEMDGHPAIFATIVTHPEGDGPAELHLSIEVPSLGLSEILFIAPVDDWSPDDGPLEVKLEVWDRELRLDLGAHFGAPDWLAPGVRLLHDRRTVRARWLPALGGQHWPNSEWSKAEGAVFSVAYTAMEDSGELRVEHLRLEDALGLSCE